MITVDRCPLTTPTLSSAPATRADAARCEAAFGPGAVCYDGVNAARLAIDFDALVGLYQARVSCEPSKDAGPGHDDHPTHPSNQ